ncbi:MAG TPA: hypothetical protein PLS23_23005 [Phycisphaerae bacterium]|nr:hypothetical protein [Phycisphaerae bacterium]
MTDDRWQRLEEKITDIQAGIAEIRTIYDAHSRRIERVEHELFGNGRAGLSAQVRAILFIVSGLLGFVSLLAANVIAAWLS